MGWDEVLAEDYLYAKASGRVAPDVTYEEWLDDSNDSVEEADGDE